jgi:outer membrane receptor protein involved in Fe transport
VPPGPAVLAVSYTGLKNAEVPVAVAASGITRKDIGLTADVYRMDQFVVASEREGNAKAITLQRLSEGVKSIVSADAFGGLAGNPADLAMRLPGVEGESVGGDMRYLRIRGLHQNLSTITQDGNRIADAGSAGATREFQFQTVGSDSIERIEVTKSPTPDMDGDSIGGAVNLVSKSAFDSSPERRIRGSVGAIWRATDPRDPARPNASLSYSEVFGGRLGVNLNLAYRPHGSIIDMTTQGHQQLAPGTEGPAYQYLLTAIDFRNIRTRSGAGLRLDYKWDDRVRFYVNLQLNKHIGRNDDNLAQFGLMQRPFPDTELGRYGALPFPAFQALGRIDNLEGDIAANPTHWRRALATDLQAAYNNHQQFREQIRAAYVMGQTQFGRLGVLAGVRIEETETQGEGALQVVTPEERARRAAWGTAPLTETEIERRAREEFGRRVRRSGDYRSVFPGLHLKYQFSRNLLARFSYAENIGRPGVGQLIPRTTVNYDNQTLSTSNPALEPQWAKNFDLGVEFYFEPAGLFTAGVFQKDIGKFIYTAGGAVVPAGAENGYDGNYAGFALTTQYNGGSAKVKGLEIGYSQQFAFLPGPWGGLGAFANATRMQAEGNYGAGTAIALAPNPRIAGFNPFVANVGGSYIRGRVNLRASLNYRDRYLGTFNANESRAAYFALRRTVDVKTLYNVNRRLSLYLDVVNIFMNPDRETQFGYGRPQTTHLMRPQFFFGANLRN